MALFGKRKPDATVEALKEQIKAAADAAHAALEMLNRELSNEEAKVRIEEIETVGDKARATLSEELTQALGTPIDHEDLFRVSRSVDDVLDSLRDFVNEVDLFGPEDRSGLIPPLKPIVEALDQFREAVDKLDDDPKAVTELGFKAQKTAGKVRKLYQAGLGELFNTETVTVDMLRSRELLRRLDVIGLRVQESTAGLSDGLMKRGLT
ncbi:MAG: DUF47 domain-containing protein [Acidimicrobiia bacterium]